MSAMRTTLVIDDDVLDRTREVASMIKRPFRLVLNEALRAGLDTVAVPAKNKQHHTRPHKMGLKPGRDINRVQELIALMDGEDAR